MISLDIAAALDNLGFQIFDPHMDFEHDQQGPATGIKNPDPMIDGFLAGIIKEPMQVIDGRSPATGFKYTLNVTNALQLRPKHWYMRGLMEYPVNQNSLWPANVELAYVRQDATGMSNGVYNGVNSFGWSIGLATCAAICHAWAAIVRMWIMGNYPEAVSPYTGPMPSDAEINAAAAHANDPNWTAPFYAGR